MSKKPAEELREDAKKANKRVQKEGASTQPITAQQDAFIKQKTRSTGNWIYAAAAIIALLLLVYFTLPLVNQNDPGAGDELAETALPARSAFTPSPYLETRINESYRNSDRISILTPPNDVQYMDSLQFRWELNANAPEGQDSLAFFILNNMEEKIFFQQVNGQQFTLMEQLSPGLYYWLLETEVETIHMGKFLMLANHSRTIIYLIVNSVLARL